MRLIDNSNDNMNDRETRPVLLVSSCCSGPRRPIQHVFIVDFAILSVANDTVHQTKQCLRKDEGKWHRRNRRRFLPSWRCRRCRNFRMLECEVVASWNSWERRRERREIDREGNARQRSASGNDVTPTKEERDHGVCRFCRRGRRGERRRVYGSGRRLVAVPWQAILPRQRRWYD